MVRRSVLPGILILMLVGVSLAACSTAGSITPSAGGDDSVSPDGVVVGDLNFDADDLPTFDPDAPLPSPGAAALRALMVLDPSVAELESDVEAAERAAYRCTPRRYAVSTGCGQRYRVSLRGRCRPGERRSRSWQPQPLVPAGSNLLGRALTVIDTASTAAVITAVASGWNDQMTPRRAGRSRRERILHGKQGWRHTTDSLDLGRNADGSTRFGFGTKSETSKNGVSVKTDVAASLDGRRCPTADGQVSFTVKVRLGAESGGAGYTQDLTAFVRAEVNDDAQISRTAFDLSREPVRSRMGARCTWRRGRPSSTKATTVAGVEYSNQRIIRHSQDATQADVSALSVAGIDSRRSAWLGPRLRSRRTTGSTAGARRSRPPRQGRSNRVRPRPSR